MTAARRLDDPTIVDVLAPRCFVCAQALHRIASGPSGLRLECGRCRTVYVLPRSYLSRAVTRHRIADVAAAAAR